MIPSGTGFSKPRPSATISYWRPDNRPAGDGGPMSKWRCIPCGYVYDPEAGDPDGGIAPGTPFEEIPDDWMCPVCGVSKDEFEKIED